MPVLLLKIYLYKVQFHEDTLEKSIFYEKKMKKETRVLQREFQGVSWIGRGEENSNPEGAKRRAGSSRYTTFNYNQFDFLFTRSFHLELR